MEIEIALRKHDLPNEFPADGSNIRPRSLLQSYRPMIMLDARVLPSLPLVTIDGETARDYDDAVYCEPLRRLQAGGGDCRCELLC